MSRYTTQVRYICENISGEYDPQKAVRGSWKEIFWADLKLFDVKHKEELFTKILLHYYTREIGMETFGMWKLYLNRKLNEILPRYNELYKTAALKFDILKDVDEITEAESTGTSEGQSGNTTATDTTNAHSDTPQGSLERVEDMTYLSDADKSTGNSESNSTSTSTNTDNSKTHRYGKTGGKTYSAMIAEYREQIVNVDLMIIDELKDLFMNVW